jgi:protein-tyrosine phosphatase/arsenate reductase
MNNKLKSLIEEISQAVNIIPSERKVELDAIVKLIVQHINEEEKLEIIVVCTHNSRRSQLGEVWINTLAQYLGLEKNIVAYSGGMEETAFNVRMVNALIDCGFEMSKIVEGENPRYRADYLELEYHPMFSKVYDDAMNPKSGFMAFMVCDHADENCPIVLGMKYRIPLRYKDPKEFDDSEFESEAYINKVKEIGREMFYLLSEVRRLS